jgi:hypothetical protein
VIIRAERAEIEAILGGMRAIAEVAGPGGVTDADRLTISAAGRVLFGLDEPDAESPHQPVGPAELARAINNNELAATACRVLGVMTMVDGELDQSKIELLREFADALGRDDTFIGVMTEAIRGEMEQSAACMIRKNIHSFTNLDQVSPDFGEVMLP